MEQYIENKLIEGLNKLWSAKQTALRKLLKQADKEHHLGVNTPEQFAILSRLASIGYGVAVKEIARETLLPHANITRTLDRMAARGLIHRTMDKTDKRRIIIKLTLEGKKAARHIKEINQQLIGILWGNLSEDERALLLTLLSKIA
ncbi:MAG: MarR family transcriptional regulator [candidate division Zixibacteria bacterium]